tara:strand:- start:8172 stop:8822 length:651 start_codon:yes stop_codon:yes gene_type:complete
MKTFNELMNTIMEAEDTPAGGYSRSAHSHYGAHRVESPEQLGRVNSFIHNYFQTEVQDKKAALAGLRQKLNQVGLDFQFTGKEELPVGEDFRIPVTRYGGTFGTSPTHDLRNGFEVTDGLESPLTLNVNCEYLENGLYNINAKIAPLSEGVEDVSEDSEHEESGEVDEMNLKAPVSGLGKKKEDKKEVPLVKLGQGDYSKEYYGDKAGKIRLRGKK